MKTYRWKPCAVAALAMFALTAAAARAEVLGSGYSLHPGQRLYSSNRQYFAVLQHDGDFVVYDHKGSRSWATGTSGSGATHATMQRTGNFVITNNDGRTIWSSNTRGRHRMFGVSRWGAAVVINARKWKPWNKKAEPFVEEVLKRRGKLDWQSPSPGYTAAHRRAAETAARREKKKVRKP